MSNPISDVDFKDDGFLSILKRACTITNLF